MDDIAYLKVREYEKVRELLELGKNQDIYEVERARSALGEGR